MTVDRSNGTRAAAGPLVDSGLCCPECEYNLTGLVDARCPECGTTFSWELVRAAAAGAPTIAFERARGWRKVPVFFVTWATVLFAPWIFARQVVRRVSLRNGLAFGAACFAGTASAFVSGMDAESYTTWLLTALLYLPLQGIWLSALDPRGWRRPVETFRFWLLAGCYTSAVMLTEGWRGPPLLLLEDLWDFVTAGHVDSWTDDLFELDVEAVLWWVQLALWITALCCVYARRIAKRPTSAVVVVWVVVVGASLLALYGASVQYIGMSIADWVDNWL